MRSIYRCKETYQGDRCKRERNHETESKDNPSIHFGDFSLWSKDGAVLKKEGAQIRHKRNRQANRAIRLLPTLEYKSTNTQIRQSILDHLNKLIAFFGRRG